MTRSVFAVLFIIYTISLNSMFTLAYTVKVWMKSINIQRILTAQLSSSGYILFKKSEDSDGNKSQYFLIDAQLNDNDSNEQQFAFDPVNDTNFLLYTSKNIDDAQFIELKNRQSLLNSNFNPSDPVRIIIHGFRDGPGAIVNNGGRKAYASKGDFNVILVDWSKGADTLNYLLAKQRIYTIGPVVAQFIEFIIETYEDKMSLSDVYLIGHSLGAHLAGVVGKSMKIGKLPVIYGLDPAGPFFSINDPDKRIDKSDAEYVEIIHTDGGVQGLEEPMGMADFYPNYGRKQPGCGSDFDGACSHQRSALFWAESITSDKGFWSVPCLSYQEIKNKTCTIGTDITQKITMGGEPANKGKASGVYYLTTASQSPFALGPL